MHLKSFKRKFYLLIIFYIFFFSASYLGYVYQLNFSMFTVLVFGIPIAYLALHFKKIDNVRILLETLVISFLTVSTIDFFAHITNTWYVEGDKLLNYIALHDYVFAFFYMLLIVYTYEYFFDDKKVANFNRYFFKLITIEGIVLLFILFSFASDNLDLFYRIEYFYLTLILMLIMMTIWGAFFAPKLLRKLLLIVIVLLPMHFIFEFIALMLGYWYFPNGGVFIKVYEINGHLIPLEEMLWFLFAVTALVIVHEYSLDDKR